MMQSDMVDLSLKEMENLDSQFRKLVPAVVNSLKDEKQTASITITIAFKLCEDSDTLVDMSTKIKPTCKRKEDDDLPPRSCRQPQGRRMGPRTGPRQQRRLALPERRAGRRKIHITHRRTER